MTATRTLAERSEAAYALPGKVMARNAVVRYAKSLGVKTILDLWGGGESARAFRAEIPDAAVISAEIDPRQWAGLMMDAQEHKYGFHLGDFRKAPGKYDFIWLDLMNQASGTMRDSLLAAKAKLNSDGVLALTLMPAREPDPMMAGPERLWMVPAWLQTLTNLKVQFLMPYKRQRNQSMWLLFLRSTTVNYWDREPDRLDGQSWFDMVEQELKEQGYFLGLACDFGIPVQDAHDWIDGLERDLGYCCSRCHKPAHEVWPDDSRHRNSHRYTYWPEAAA